MTICGSFSGFKNGKGLRAAEFTQPNAICIDPRRPLNVYVGDESSIRYVDTTGNEVRLVAGHKQTGHKDGVGAKARFNSLVGLICSKDGNTLYLSDYNNHRIVSVDTTTRAVTSIVAGGVGCRDGKFPTCSVVEPWKLAFNRSESAFWISSSFAIRRYDIKEKELSTHLILKPTFRMNPYALAVTPSDHLIVWCMSTSAWYSIDSKTGAFVLLSESTFGKRKDWLVPSDMTIVDAERAAFVVDCSMHCVLRMPLPDKLFVAS